MPFKNQRQRAACYAADDPNWDCEKYAKGEDNEDTFNGAVNDVLQRVDKDNITVEGIGVYTYDHLKANVKAKVKDLLERTEAGVHTGIGKTQLNVLAAMWQALVDYENSRD